MAEKRLGAAMKAAQKFPKMKDVYNNEGCTGKGPRNEGWTKKALRKTKALIP